MSRNSRIWQDSLAHSTVYDGDATECVKWLGWAKQKLQLMLHNTAGPLTATYTPADDITVRVDTRPNRIQITSKSGGIYMESGFIDFISTGKCTEAAYRPGTLNYNAKVTAELDSLTPIQGKVKLKATDLPESPFTGELLVDGSTSLAVGCKESVMVQEVVTPDPCGITYTSGGYCGLSLWARKKCMEQVPATMYSGKTRLLVQAMYGSTRTDFSNTGHVLTLVDESGVTYANPRDGAIKMGNTGVNLCYWLYTIGFGGYALCYLEGDDIVMIPLLLNPAAQKFAETLASHPDKDDFVFATKVEAYILAYAKPVYDSSAWVRIPVSGTPVLGEPLAYGWHTNWKGDEAHIVCFYASGARFVSNQYKLTISQVVTEGVVSFSVDIAVTQANKEWSNWTTFIYPFYYDEGSQQMVALAKPSTLPPDDFNFDSPIYCFTKLDLSAGDCVLSTVNVVNDKNPSASYNNYNNVWPDNHGSFHYEDRKNYSSVTAKKGQIGVKVVGAGAFSLMGDYEDAHTSLYEDWVHNGAVYWVSQKAGTDTYGHAGPWYVDHGFINSGVGPAYLMYNSSTTTFAFVEWEMGQYSRHGIANNGTTKTVKAIAEVPHYSCDSIILGIEERLERTGPFYERVSSGVGLVHRDSRLNEAVFNSITFGWERTGNILASASVGHLAPTDSGIGGTNTMSLNDPAFDTFLQSLSGNSFTYTTQVKESVGSEDPSQPINTNVTVSNTDPYPNDARYFAPSLSSPGTATTDVVKSSIQSGSMTAHTLYNSDYGFIKNASVGWA